MNDKQLDFKNPLVDPRPFPITIICILGFSFTLVTIASVFTIPIELHHLVVTFGESFPVAMFIISFLMIISFFGIWRMKLWGVILYGVTFAIDAIYLHMIGFHELPGYVFWGTIPDLIVVVVCLLYIKKMS